jgi:hypothetical protein
VPELPRADWSAPGWNIRQGQAVWRLGPGELPLSGELLLATRDGQTIVQFAKPPFTLVSAQAAAQGWALEMVFRRHRTGGRGTPPKNTPWFALADAITGRDDAGSDWRFTNHNDGAWRLENGRTGESLDGYLKP